MILTPLQAIDCAVKGGFGYNTGVVRIVAIGYAESSLKTDATYTNTDTYKSIDRGWLMINNHWHAEVSDACAFDPYCAAKEAFRISNQGQSFSPWATYGDGSSSKPYYRFMPIARLAYDYYVYKNGATDKISELNQQVLQLQADLAKAQADSGAAQVALAQEVDLVNKLVQASDTAVAALQAAKA